MRLRILLGPLVITAATLLLAFLAVAPRAATARNPAALDTAAPELLGGPWLNTRGGKPITLVSRRGKVTIVEFWTFG